MNTPIAKLEQVDMREAWAHEAHDFTPWLAENLEHLSDAVGIKLELEGTEVAVETFSADILARNVFDDSRVLIENQLAPSDHSHLGQILTYLAGLEANTVIWIASDFREPHLSAINWLNSNTEDSVSFFAIRLKVVRIGDSPFAPVFDVMARPNNWEKRLHKTTSKSGERSQLSIDRFMFWKAYVERIPGEEERNGGPTYVGYRWIQIEDLDLVVSLYMSVDGVGLYITAPRSGSREDVFEMLTPYASILKERFGVEIGKDNSFLFVLAKSGDFKDEYQYADLIDWLHEKATDYERALKEVLKH